MKIFSEFYEFVIGSFIDLALEPNYIGFDLDFRFGQH